MAEEIYKTRVLAMYVTPHTRARSWEEWNGRDSDEKHGTITVKREETVYTLTVREVDLHPVRERLNERERELSRIVRDNPELDLNRSKIETTLDEVGDVIKEVEVDDDMGSLRYCNSYVYIHKGMRGQYVRGISGNPIVGFDAKCTPWSSEEVDDNQLECIFVAQDILEEEGVLDERYRIE